ncbi:GntR family transcriptional regulator [Bacillus pseudomycoides]|uniref:GntR family transcriptional regulator n=1 Tax=Bacillus pseudomycoides TaxID=64104 RepID=A0A2C3PVZ8_9BACI|nr:GntR family transcriptional regulator [Bacillus pseudomycoides]PEA85352.1 GntR family transcriptional regulator [Bacillus pseudomycoides]PED09943.1 GntR family transcriptional regulator [Bacillus pseudomycoides]PED70832.1 GntR family transcriptional regulator [Bacillus pseudomycoides]PEE41984.1 GntR family transcriptional regulator [Bacillus pseudomycoides]
MLLHIQLDPRSNTPIWEQIVQNIKELVLKSMLAPNDKLPSVRELASLLVINPNTVSKAYQELERQGIIETLRGKGTFVSQSITPTWDERKIAMVEKQFHQLLLEASYLGITKEKIHDWIDSYYKELGGNTNAKSDGAGENN